MKPDQRRTTIVVDTQLLLAAKRVLKERDVTLSQFLRGCLKMLVADEGRRKTGGDAR